ncbi:tetratricopeptide repeat protein, partial [Streptomyces sp. NPDC002920]
EARESLYAWLLETTVLAGRWFEPDHGAPPPGRVRTVDLSTADRARVWLRAEGANWLAALRAAAVAGEHTTVVEVAEALHWFSDQWIFWGHWPEVFGTAARSARELGDPVLEATHLNYHAWALLTCEDRPEDSLARSAEALAIARGAGDLRQEAWSHIYRAMALRRLGDYAPAAEHMRRAAPLFEAVGDLPGTLQALHGRGVVLLDAGNAERALVVYRDTLAFLERCGDRMEPHIARFSRGGLFSDMGRCYALLERWPEAVDHLGTSVSIYRESGNTAMESRQLVGLGNALLSAGRPAEAREVFARCVSLGPAADPQRVAEARDALARLDAR